MLVIKFYNHKKENQEPKIKNWVQQKAHKNVKIHLKPKVNILIIINLKDKKIHTNQQSLLLQKS